MKNNYKLIFSFGRVPIDFVIVFFSSIASYFLRPYTEFIPFIQILFLESQLISFGKYLIFSYIISFGFLIISSLSGLYSFKVRRLWKESVILFLSNSLLILCIPSVYALLWVETFFSRGVLMMIFLQIFIYAFISRVLLNSVYRFFAKKGKYLSNIAIFGDSSAINYAYKRIKNNYLFNCVYKNAYFDPKNIPIKDIDEIWFAKGRINKYENDLLHFAQSNQKLFRIIPNARDVLYAKTEESEISGMPILSMCFTRINGWNRVFKRLFDVIFSIIFIFLFSPFFIVVSCLIKLDSKGSVFYNSTRVGKNGKCFNMIKFRTMVNNADVLKEKLLSKNIRKNSPLFKIKSDPRVTKIGKVLRRFSIDELPQLFNVLIGDLSLVGPRAHLPDELVKYSPDQSRVLIVKPGITGISQVSGRSDLPFEKEIELDLYYIVNWSFLWDLFIIIKTVNVVIEGSGAD